MALQKKQAFQIIAAVVIVLLFGFLIFRKTADHNQPPKPGNENQNQTLNPPVNQNSGSQSAQTLEGKLEISDNLQKGNLMIATPQRNIYLFTSRNFAGLLNREVVVTYTGTLTNFVLEDIAGK